MDHLEEEDETEETASFLNPSSESGQACHEVLEMEPTNSDNSGNEGSRLNGNARAMDTVDVSISVINTDEKDLSIETLGTVPETPERRNSFKYPIHAAAQKGDVKALKRLLVKGDPVRTDYKERTPLHYACGYPYQKKAFRMLELILKCPGAQDTPEDPSRKINLINFQDKEGETGLHIAARTGHGKVVEKLLFSAADVNLKDKNKIEPLHTIYNKVPAAMKPIYDGAIECKVGDPDDLNLIVRFDFGAIVGYPEPVKIEPFYDLETKLLSYSLQQSEQKRSAILLHPIVRTFLFLKWKKIRKLLWISIFYHVIWLLLYTTFIWKLYFDQCPYKIPKDQEFEDHHPHADGEPIVNSNETLISNNATTPPLEVDGANITGRAQNVTSAVGCEIDTHLLSSINLVWWFLINVSISIILKELYEIYSSTMKQYITQLENIGQWLLIGVVLVTSIPIFMNHNDSVVVIHAWQYQAAALGILLAWSLILSQIAKIPRFGLYIEILSKVLRSFVMFMITFASLLVAFMVSFQILMPEKQEFESFPWGLIRIVVMMSGEINYDDMFYNEEHSGEIPFPSSTKLLYAAFVSVVTIILFNLLIGLTVSDIQGLQSVGQLSSLSSQVEQIYLMEKFIMSKRIQRTLISINKNHWLRRFLVTQQTDDTDSNMGLDLHIAKIPKDLQHPVREIAAPNYVQEETEDEDEDNSKRSRKDSNSSTSSKSKAEDEVDASLHKIQQNAKDRELRQQMKSILKELLHELQIEKSTAMMPMPGIFGEAEEDE